MLIAHFPDRNRPRQAFTLVELLVVIAIIALLVGLLLPTLKAARYTARKIVSLNNMHQVSLLIFAYAEDNKTFVPNTGREDYSNRWDDPYIASGDATIGYTWGYDTIGYTIHPYVTNSNIFMAANHWDHLVEVYLPASNAGSGLFYAFYGWYGNPAATYYLFTSYAYLPVMGGYPRPALAGPTLRLGDPVPGSSVQFNNVTILEEVVAGLGSGGDTTNPDSPYKSVNFVNGKPDGGNIVFGDGSGNYVPIAGYNGGLPKQYQFGGYDYGTLDIFYRY